MLLKMDIITRFSKWTKKYGKVFGFYEAGTPSLAVADLDVVKEILIKQFDNFEQQKNNLRQFARSLC